MRNKPFFLFLGWHSNNIFLFLGWHPNNFVLFLGWHPGVWQHDAGGGEGAPEKDEEVWKLILSIYEQTNKQYYK